MNQFPEKGTLKFWKNNEEHKGKVDDDYCVSLTLWKLRYKLFTEAIVCH